MRVLFGIFKAFAWLISKLPDRTLYALSAFFCFVLKDVIRYRKLTVHENLANSFPNISQLERNKIARQYYLHMTDLMLEVIKTPGLSADGIKNRISFRNPELLHEIHKSGKSIVMLAGHCGNWEWLGPGIHFNFPEFEGYAVVKPISNPYFNKYISELRMLHKKDSLIPFKQTLRYMINKKNQQTINLFLADQTPHHSEINFVTNFLNQETPFFTGYGKIAKMLDQAVVFINLYRTKRGYYEAEFTLISDNPASTAEYEISHAFIRLLEQAIKERPYNWLWSHRRWKYAPKADQTEIKKQV